MPTPKSEPRAEGLESGYPQVAFDPDRCLPYHLDGTGARVYHAAPAGWEFDRRGRLRPAPPATPGTPAPSSAPTAPGETAPQPPSAA